MYKCVYQNRHTWFAPELRSRGRGVDELGKSICQKFPFWGNVALTEGERHENLGERFWSNWTPLDRRRQCVYIWRFTNDKRLMRSKNWPNVLPTTNCWTCTDCTSKPLWVTMKPLNQVCLTWRANTSGKHGINWKVLLKKMPNSNTLSLLTNYWPNTNRFKFTGFDLNL